MAAVVQGATRSDAFKFSPDEAKALAISPQLVRFEKVNAEHVEWLARDIAKNGQQAPVLIRKRGDDTPELVAGRHRHAAVLKINGNTADYGVPASGIPLLAVLKQYTDEQAIRASFTENTGLPLSVMDLATAASHFYNVMDWPHKHIAEAMSAPHHKMSPIRVGQLLRLLALPVSLQRRLHTGKLPESVAKAFLRLGLSAEEMKEKAAQLERGEIKPSELTSAANQKRRAEGKKVKRSLSEVRTRLGELETARALDFLSWIDGDLNDDDRVVEIFADEE